MNVYNMGPLIHFANNHPSNRLLSVSAHPPLRVAGRLEPVPAVHPGHKETHKHLHLYIHTFRQLRGAKEPKVCVLGGCESAEVPGENSHKGQGEHAPRPPHFK